MRQVADIGSKSMTRISPPEGLYALFGTLVSQAIAFALERHYASYTPIKNWRHFATNAERDREIRTRYAKGESIHDLAEVYGLSEKRIYQIVKS
jgi:hypothetical protein